MEADLQKHASRVCKHMNEDHGDSLLAWAHHYAGLRTATEAKSVGLTASGFLLDVTLGDGRIVPNVLVKYQPPIQKAVEVRKAAVAMHFEAFHGLGVGYKLRHGFYSGMVQQGWSHAPTSAKVAAAGAGAVLAAIIVVRSRRR